MTLQNCSYQSCLDTMKQIFVYVIVCNLIHIVLNKKIEDNEDVHFLQESIKRFGPPRPLNYKNCNLPGPEVITDKTLFQKHLFISDDSGNYTLKLRAITENFSYNNNYEEAVTKITNTEKIFSIRGQFTEKIPRKSGGFFLRTIGYISNERGYFPFLVDVTKVTTEVKKTFKRTGGKNGCGKRKRRSPLSPCLLASLAG